MQFIGSGSDYKGLQHNLGVPSLDIRFTHDNVSIKTTHMCVIKQQLNTCISSIYKSKILPFHKFCPYFKI